MGYDINWHVSDGDSVLNHPTYQVYSQQTFELLNLNEVKDQLRKALASNEAAPVVNYLSWLIRVLALVTP